MGVYFTIKTTTQKQINHLIKCEIVITIDHYCIITTALAVHFRHAISGLRPSLQVRNKVHSSCSAIDILALTFKVLDK